MSKLKNFRLSEETCGRLADLARERGVSERRVVEDLIMGDYEPGPVDLPEEVAKVSVSEILPAKEIKDMRVSGTPVPPKAVVKRRKSDEVEPGYEIVRIGGFRIKQRKRS